MSKASDDLKTTIKVIARLKKERSRLGFVETSILRLCNTICNTSLIVDKWDPLDKFLVPQHGVSGGRTLVQANPQCQDIIWLTTTTT